MREELTVNIAICDDQGEWIEQVESYLVEFRKIHRNIKWEAFYSAEETCQSVFLIEAKETSYVGGMN